MKEKIALFCNVEEEAVIPALDVEFIYQVPLAFSREGLDEILLDKLHLPHEEIGALTKWEEIVRKLRHPEDEVRIGFVGKYVEFGDSYKSLNEALMHGGIANNVEGAHRLHRLGGARRRGLSRRAGAAWTASWSGRASARAASKGSCARSATRARSASPSSASASACSARRSSSRATWSGMVGANSTEFDDESPYKVIYKLRDLIGVDALGGTMRLGKYPCALKEGSIAREAYGAELVEERHRHRYEVNPEYVPAARGERLPRDRRVARRQVRRDHRARRPSVVPRLPVPSRVQVAPDRAAPALPLVHRRGEGFQEDPRCKRRDEGRAAAGRTGFMTRAISIRDGIAFGGDQPPLFIAGPCVIESRDHAMRMGEIMLTLRDELGINLIFKSSYDKANRSSIDSFRGPGLEKGLAILQEVGRETGLPTISDIHEPSQAAPAAEVLDILQIPAFLCRQTDLVEAAARTGKPVGVKKGQFLSPGRDEEHSGEGN